VAAVVTESPASSLRRDEATTPDPEDERKPDSPAEIKGPTWRFVMVKVWREFSDDQCTDLAAALTYYAVLAIFPAAVALFALLGVVSNPQQAVQTVVDVLGPLVSAQTLGTIQPALEGIASSQTAGPALVLGVVGALWSASGYVGAFSRALNRIYEIHEGRPFWKLRPLMLVITLVAVLLVGVVLLMLVVSGPLAQSIGDVVGLGGQAVTVWNIAKWPVIVVIVMTIVALLYYATPNVQQPKFRWLSVGAVVAIVIWIVASVGFAFYAANFASYNKTYGSLAGVIVGLVFLWLTNVALLLGAEIDSELERGRQLQAGIAAERELQLPARDTRGSVKAAKKEAKDEAKGRQIRVDAEAALARRGKTSGGTESPSDDPTPRRNP
jgi:membrane protein